MLRLGDILDKVSSYRPDADLDIIKKAYVYSAKVHQGQVRKSGEPYLVHPLAVAGLLADLRLDEASIVTGLLHDTVEDTLATLEEVEDLFGPEVAALVDGVTKISQFSAARRPSAEEKQAENFRKMIVAMAKDIRVILVKLADRTHNMRTLEHMPPEKQERIARETLEIYAPLANRLGIQWIKTELEDLSFKYLRPHDYQELVQKLSSKRREHARYIEEVRKILASKLEAQGIPAEVQGRLKHLYSIYRKMRANNIEFEEVHDLIAFRIITDTVTRCYEALGLLHSLWKPVPGRFKDYIAIPKPNMYQSLHTTVIGPYGERVEIQIRTHEMHRVAEEGIAAHWNYKEKGSTPAALKDAEGFAWLRQLLEWQQDLQDPKEFLETVKVDLFTDEVFVFTPKGEVRSFPRGATPVDFAYAVHTEVGHHCVGAKVNGRIVPLRYKLKNGDTVEILTSNHANPSKDWLTFVKTSRAQARIRSFIRKQQRDRSIAIGREILDKEVRKFGRSLNKLVKSGEIEKAAEGFGLKSTEELFSNLGYGKLTPPQVSAKLFPEAERERKEPERTGRLAQIFKKVARTRRDGISVQGIDDVLVRFGRCCNPVVGDPIVGFITRGRGVTVHTADCEKVLATDPDRRVEVSWDDGTDTERPVSLRVVTSDRRGLLAELSQAFSACGVNISQANCRATGDDRAVNTFEVSVTDIKQLNGVIRELERIKGVYSVERV
ncbi:MAG: bifunctional (p)ppGpp synthetase/guanosine-3',5'-bis(diphosphate) 3'-pyrophosphohydrolase [Deltaproteobacteria bacterium]|nr:MAG: bifunctional (p)ppGpp synthetase/guanosine-3',5'-bis(diphosphate) 3'-pyrophosphohydrolase [Deltaproteobacteria bacterium]